MKRVLVAVLVLGFIVAAGCGNESGESADPRISSEAEAPTVDQVIEVAGQVPGYEGCGKIGESLIGNQPASSVEPSESIAITCDGGALVLYDSYPDESAREDSGTAFTDFYGLLADNVRIWYPNIEAPDLPKGVQAGPDNARELFDLLQESCGCGEIATR